MVSVVTGFIFLLVLTMIMPVTIKSPRLSSLTGHSPLPYDVGVLQGRRGEL